jgi:hypothetical protein
MPRLLPGEKSKSPKPEFESELKKIEGRILAALASENGLPKSTTSIVLYLAEKYDKKCLPETAEEVIDRLTEWEFAFADTENSNEWKITLEGSTFLKKVSKKRPVIFEKTTSPQIFAFA